MGFVFLHSYENPTSSIILKLFLQVVTSPLLIKQCIKCCESVHFAQEHF